MRQAPPGPSAACGSAGRAARTCRSERAMTTAQMEPMNDVRELLGADPDKLLDFETPAVNRSQLHLPGPDFVDRVVAPNRPIAAVLKNLQAILDHGRLGGTGYRLDPARRPGRGALRRRELRAQSRVLRPGEHRAACDRGRVQRGREHVRRAGRHGAEVRPQNPLHRQVQPQRADDVSQHVQSDPFGTIRQCHEMGAAGVGATIYFGSPESGEQIQ